MNNIYLFDGKTRSGPFTEEEIKKLHLSPGTLFWYYGLSQWLPVEKLTIANIDSTKKIYSKPELNRKNIRLYWGLTILITLFIFFLYGIFFDEFSESELIELSFYWITPLVFIVTALISTYSRSKKPAFWGLIASLVAILHLVLFFIGLWSSL